MKHMKLKLSLLGLSALLLTPGLQAQNDKPKAERNKDQGANANYGSKAVIGAPMAVNKASQLIGMAVKDQNGDKIGDLKEVVIDFPSGKIAYGVFGSDGKERLFAIPLAAYQAAPDQKHLILQIDKQKFENAQGFDKSAWPSIGNPNFPTDSFWQQPLPQTGRETSSRTETQTDPNSPTGRSDALRSSAGIPMEINKATKLIGMNVKNPQNENLGEIKDLVVDLQGQQVSYVVLGSGGALGIGEKFHALPLNAFSQGTEKNVLVLNASKDKLNQHPSFDKDNWPNVSNPSFGTPFWESSTTTPGLENRNRNVPNPNP